MPRPLDLSFVQSAASSAQLPDDPSIPEVAIVGRSNVGKSSVVNALANRRALAKVSKTPGRTQLLNYFRLGDHAAVVDLPGYGYAKVPANVRAKWQRMIEEYLLEREQLKMVVVLVDGAVGPTALDLTMLDWLRAFGRPHQVVATKHDKVKASVLARRRRDLAAKCDLEPADVLWTSAEKGTGIDVLRSRLAMWLETS